MEFDFFLEPTTGEHPVYLGYGTLDEGKKVADALEALWQAYTSDRWMIEFTSSVNLMSLYEGCNIVATNNKAGVKYLYTDHWELV
jgi:hypothetical protein